jgi:hypothetical protein
VAPLSKTPPTASPRPTGPVFSTFYELPRTPRPSPSPCLAALPAEDRLAVAAAARAAGADLDRAAPGDVEALADALTRREDALEAERYSATMAERLERLRDARRALEVAHDAAELEAGRRRRLTAAERRREGLTS